MPIHAVNSLIARYQVDGLTNDQKVELANKVLAKMKELGALPSPVHYAIIYESIEKIDPLLAKEIQQSIDSGAYNDQAADKFISELITNYLIQNIPSQQVELLLKNLLQQIEKWLVNSKNSEKAVYDGINAISELNIPDAIKNTLFNEIVPAIEVLLKDTEELQVEAVEASDEIRQLKMELEQANNMAKTDELTNIPNRRGFNEMAEKVLKHSQEEDSIFSLAIIDIDFFKSINDEFGHLVGDSVLRYLARLLDSETKGKDFVARLGGEEFVILLPNTSLENALKVAENLREKVEQTKLQVKNHFRKLRLTISCGVATYQEDLSIDDILVHADDALYLAKNSGRNQTKGEHEV